ncbi:hypothetical protein D3C87_277930 [compost metagenome]
MIKIHRGPAPEYLFQEKIQQAIQRLEENFYKESRLERLRFDSSVLIPVKEELFRLFHEKCAYCESSLRGQGDIECFRPKGGARGFDTNTYAPKHYWWLAYEWENLLPACQLCNLKYKRDYFPLENENLRCRIGAVGEELLQEQALLINPCLDDPEEHLVFEASGLVRELSKKGAVTIKLLGLNRNSLAIDRKMAADSVKNRLKDLQKRGLDDSGLVAYVDELFSESPSQQHVAVQRTVFDDWYEKHSGLWEQVKKEQNNTAETVRHQRMSKSAFPEAAAISEVTTIMNDLKRFSIKKVEIINFKSIEELTLDVKDLHEKDNREPWLLLLGDNGIGKSSILQAIALALTSRKQLEKLNLDVTDYLKKGAGYGRVTIHSYEHDKPVVLEFNKEGFTTELEESPTFLLAYGSTRLLPKGNIEPDEDKEPYQNIRNLFDYSVALNDPNDWLGSMDEAEFKERVAPAFFDTLALKGQDQLWINDGQIMIRRYGEDYELEDTSDGYKTITALVSDIMQTLSIDKTNYHNMQGIVLIDELGNHLHPRWRLKIAGALRKAFPKLQFIVTTHEPLCLRGLSHGEVNVLVRNKKNSIKVLASELLPDHNLMRMEQLLTSDLFGLINVLDEDAESTYEEYYRLLSKKEADKTEEDKAQIEYLSSQISKTEMIGNSPREQVFYKVIDEVFAQKMRDEGFKTRKKLNDATVETVKDMIKTKKIKWL